MEAMERLSGHLKNRTVKLSELRGKGIKIIGFAPGDFMPEELVYAAGAIPVGLIRGGDPEPVMVSSAYLPRFYDTFCRSQIGYRMLEEEPLYQMIDLLVCPLTDNNMKAMADCWNFYTDVDVFRYGVPHNKSEDAFEYYLGGLHLLKDKLQEVTGNKITDEKLKKAIGQYNKMRGLLKDISLLRKSQRPPISGREFVELNHASYYGDISFMLELLQPLYEERKNKEAPVRAPRILLTGSTLAMGDYKVLDLVESAGAAVVIEEFCEGVRHYWENVENSGDLMRALADKYFRRRVSPAFFRPSTDRIDFVLRLAKDFNADGVIWYQLMYRDSYDIQSFYFAKTLRSEVGIPMLKIQSDYDVSEIGPLRTRVSTFIETIKRGESHARRVS